VQSDLRTGGQPREPPLKADRKFAPTPVVASTLPVAVSRPFAEGRTEVRPYVCSA